MLVLPFLYACLFFKGKIVRKGMVCIIFFTMTSSIENLMMYLRLRFGFLGQGMNLPGKGGRNVSVAGYKISQKFFGFN